MIGKKRLPYGGWPSMISAAMVASSGRGSSALPREVYADGTGVYWTELRPEENGRCVIQHRDPTGNIQTLTPAGFSARTRVHEYGGGSYLVSGNGIYFSNETDQRLYWQPFGELPQPVTPAPGPGEKLRFANGCAIPNGDSLIYICEQHAKDGSVENNLALLSPQTGFIPKTIHSGHDFYANPRVSPDGSQIVWMTWDLPRMPWEGSDLWLASLEDGSLKEIKHIAGGPSEAIFQPEWGPKGEVYFVSDATGWWNLYRWVNGVIEAITALEVDFGLPMWMLSYSTYTILSQNLIVATYLEKGLPSLAIIDTQDRSIEHLPLEYNYMTGSIASDPDQRVWFLAGSGSAFPGLSCLDLKTREIKRIHEVKEYDIKPEYISQPEQIAFNSPMGSVSYTYYYAPTNPEYAAKEHELPPLIVMGHGGPTSAARPYLSLDIQFWTSRGFAVADVDYSGSTGYGRAYRDRLKGQWGVIDVADCVHAAIHLGDVGLADPNRLLIAGGSAGGYIVLSALTGYDLFASGASYYGVADILALMQDTHKFESGYDTYLIGPLPEYEQVYRERSPIYHAQNLSCPVILFQGLDDKVVLPSQSEVFVEALAKNHIPHKYITFDGEGHGFRRAANIQKALEEELAFYREVLQIEGPDE